MTGSFSPAMTPLDAARLGLPLAQKSRQKPRQIIRHVVDEGGVLAFHLPWLASGLPVGLGHHQHRRHAEAVWHLEVAREVLEHRGTVRRDGVSGEKPLDRKSTR